MYKALAEHLLVDYYSFRVKKVEKEVRNLARKAFIFPILPGVEEGWKAIFYYWGLNGSIRTDIWKVVSIITHLPVYKSLLKNNLFCFKKQIFWLTYCLKITQNVALEVFNLWHFSTIFGLLKMVCHYFTSSFQKLAKMDHFVAILINFRSLKIKRSSLRSQ